MRVAFLKNIAPGLCVLAALLPGSAPARSAPDADETFLAAHAAARHGEYARLARYAQELQGYALEPYVQFWLLRARLEDATPEAIGDFLEREQGTVLAEQLRREWLKLLGKREQWPLFRAEHPRLANDDADIGCYALQARWEQQDASALEELGGYWSAPRELPEGCQPLAQVLVDLGRLGRDQIWARVRRLLETGAVSAAWRTAGYLPQAEAPERGQLFAVAAGPKRYLEDKKKRLTRRAERELVLFALQKLARTEPLAAAAHWDKKLRAHFSEEERAYAWGQLALQAARQNLPQALAWYREAEALGAQWSEEHLAWRLRAALRQGDWKEVDASAQRMSPAQRGEPAWIYWQGRAAQAQGRAEEARALFGRIAGEHHFYARLAAEELGLPFSLPQTSYTPTEEEIGAIARGAGFQRALALYRLGLRTDATREWVWAIRGMDDKQLLAAAEFARRNAVYDRAINTADKTRQLHDFRARYLAPFRDALGEQARAQQLEEAWVLGLVRQESRFIPEIRSSAGASGLMQLMPATAKWVARRMGMQDFSWARVTDANVNAALGTYYLRHVLEDLGGNPVLAAAAYNAGPGRARKWRDSRPLEGAIYAETIPFNETRDYVKKVMSNTMYYAALLGEPARSLKERLGMIAARVDGAGAARTSKEDDEQ